MDQSTGELRLIAALDRETDDNLLFTWSCNGNLMSYRHNIVIIDVDDNGPHTILNGLIIKNRTIVITLQDNLSVGK